MFAAILLRTLDAINAEFAAIADVSATECETLSRVLKVLKSYLSRQSLRLVSASARLDRESGLDIRAISKFRHIVEILELSLSEILARFEAGVYHQAGFAMPAELVQWIERLFASSPKREQAIVTIRGI